MGTTLPCSMSNQAWRAPADGRLRSSRRAKRGTRTAGRAERGAEGGLRGLHSAEDSPTGGGGAPGHRRSAFRRLRSSWGAERRRGGARRGAQDSLRSPAEEHFAQAQLLGGRHGAGLGRSAAAVGMSERDGMVIHTAPLKQTWKSTPRKGTKRVQKATKNARRLISDPFQRERFSTWRGRRPSGEAHLAGTIA
ncbi:unnamed protein product [Ostreobium quekettii]|uniref:Uncharacterized protein n=1 Tax=Ostreobium quekettii TaxID=121088 RepID=A0A8S1IQN0_9CHLO|nr:unnamed protein product [Ostreobium quekettii]